MQDLIFETDTCYWQNQPGREKKIYIPKGVWNCCDCFHSLPVNLLDNEALSAQHQSTKVSINDKRLKNHG